jgi:pimeloyl-ACP methyl ester carboxylesterase
MILEAVGGVAEGHLRMQGFQREQCGGVGLFRGGMGPPMLLLHGALSRASTTWGLVAGRLARRFHVLAPDLPGFGRSRAALRPEEATVRRVAEALLERLPEWTGGKPCVVVGGSLGGWIAARMALEQPRAVEQLFLIDAAGHWVDEEAGRALVGIILPDTPDALNTLFSRVSGRHIRLPRFLAQDFVTSYRRDFAPLRNLVAAGETDVLIDTELAGMINRVSVVWGAQDRLIPLEEGRALAAAIPGATFDVIERCAHVPQVEAAGRFVDVVLKRTGNQGAIRRGGEKGKD